MRRSWFALALAVALILALPLTASANWFLDAFGGAGYGRAHTMPAGDTPSLAVNGRSVNVSWDKNVLTGGTDVQDYIVRRYDASSGTLQNTRSSCDNYVSTLSCTEGNLPPGTWTYSVTPRFENWLGAESAPSAPLTIAAPSISFSSPTNIASLDAVLNGTVANFRSNSSLTFKLDDPATGAVLAGTTSPNTIPASGTASFSVTIPRGTSAGSHVVYATDGQGESANAPINVNIAAPSPTSFTTTNGGNPAGAGRIQAKDSFSIAFSQQLDVGSLCSTWSGDNMAQSVNADNAVTVNVNNNASLLGNDTITVTTSANQCGGSFRLGTVDLGSPGFLTGDATFAGAGANSSSITWNPGARTLTVTLGAQASGSALSRLNLSLTATYTPNASIRNSSWIPITGTASRVGVLF